jgi:hypothetical protein
MVSNGGFTEISKWVLKKLNGNWKKTNREWGSYKDAGSAGTKRSQEASFIFILPYQSNS